MFNHKLLYDLIERSGMSLQALGRDMGITHSTISLLLRGKSLRPQPETVNSLAQYFGISPAELLNDTITVDAQFTQNSDAQLGSLSETLKYLIERSGIVNSSQLHRYTGIAIPTIDRIINGETQSPSLKTMSKLAEFFDITIPQLKGIDKIPQGKVFTTIPSNANNIPLININSVSEWLTSNNKTLIIKYLKSELLTLGNNSFAIEYKANPNVVTTYMIDPDITPRFGDTIVVTDGISTNIFEYFSQSLYLSLKNEEIAVIPSKHKILGVSVQELRQRI